MPAQAGIQGRGGWIPACAGMTEQRVVIDAQIIAARGFSQEDTKITKFGILIIGCLRVRRAFVVYVLCPGHCAFQASSSAL
jgi:hypothetical protein